MDFLTRRFSKSTDSNDIPQNRKISLEQPIHPNPHQAVNPHSLNSSTKPFIPSLEDRADHQDEEAVHKLGLNSALWWDVNPNPTPTSDWTLSLGLGPPPSSPKLPVRSSVVTKAIVSSAKSSAKEQYGMDYENLAVSALKSTLPKSKKVLTPILTPSQSRNQSAIDLDDNNDSSAGNNTPSVQETFGIAGKKRKAFSAWIPNNNTFSASKRQRPPDSAFSEETGGGFHEFQAKSPFSPLSQPDSSDLNHNYPNGTESGSSYYAMSLPSTRRSRGATPSTASMFTSEFGMGMRNRPTSGSTGDLLNKTEYQNHRLPRSKSTGQVFNPNTWEYQVVENLLNTKSTSSPSAAQHSHSHSSVSRSTGAAPSQHHSNTQPGSPLTDKSLTSPNPTNSEPYGPQSLDLALSGRTESRGLYSPNEHEELDLSDSDNDSFVSAADSVRGKDKEKDIDGIPVKVKHSTQAAIVWAMGVGPGGFKRATFAANPRLSMGKTVSFAMPLSDSENDMASSSDPQPKKMDIDLSFELPPKRLRTRSKIDYSSDPNFLALSPHDLKKKWKEEKRKAKGKMSSISRSRSRSRSRNPFANLSDSESRREDRPKQNEHGRWTSVDFSRPVTPASGEMETFIGDIRASQQVRKPSPQWRSAWSVTSAGETDASSAISSSVAVPTSFKPFLLIPPNAYMFVGGFLLFPLWIAGAFYPVTGPDGRKERWGGWFKSETLQRRKREVEGDLEKGNFKHEEREMLERKNGPISGWPKGAGAAPDFGRNGDELPLSKRLSNFLRETDDRQRVVKEVEDFETLNFWAFQRAVYTWRLRCRVMLILSWVIIVPFIVVGIVASR